MTLNRVLYQMCQEKHEMREWLSWWSATLPRSRPRVRVPSRALKKIRISRKTGSYFFVSTSAHKPMQTCMGSESTLRFGPRRTNVHWTLCAPSNYVVQGFIHLYLIQTKQILLS